MTDYFGHQLTEEDSSAVLREITSYSIDSRLPEVSGDTNIVEWWTQVEHTKRYPVLCKIAMGVLSIFHGPRVESTFNVMGDVIGIKSGRMNVETYSSIQSVKNVLKARKTTALKMFKRKDMKFSPVDRHICLKLRSAAGRYKQKQNSLRVQKLRRLHHYARIEKVESKTSMKKKLMEAHNQSYFKHLKTEAQRVKKRILTDRLTELCAKRKKLSM